MSEENKIESTEVAFGFTGKEDQIRIQFADGVRAIPDYVIRGIGGISALEKIAPKLIEKTYGEFLSGFSQVILKRDLNTFQQRFVSNHFSKRW